MLRVLRAEMSKWFLIHACSTRGISCIGLSHGCRTSCGGYTFSQSGNAEPPSPRLVAEISFIKQVFNMKFLQVAPTLPPFLSVCIGNNRAQCANVTGRWDIQLRTDHLRGDAPPAYLYQRSCNIHQHHRTTVQRLPISNEEMIDMALVSDSLEHLHECGSIRSAADLLNFTRLKCRFFSV